jgi:signal transduction histidine kinase/AraC-like DNA-binding protein
MLDAYGGMMSLLSHLREAHGYEKIAFVRGPEQHQSANDRYAAYRDFHAANGMGIDEALVTSPLPWDEGRRAVEELLDRRGLVPGQSFQAVVAASDLLAFWFLRGLEARGYQVPADVAVAGFNDSPESLLSTPPLTTVAMPFKEQGAKGLEMLHEMWEGSKEPEEIVLPARLVVRESCGCPSMEAELAERAERGDAGALLSAECEATGDASLAGAIFRAAASAGLGEAETIAWMEPLARAFADDLREGSSKRFPAMLGRILDREVHGARGAASWQNAISSLRRAAAALVPGADPATVSGIVARARVMIGQAMARRGTFERWSAEEDAKKLRSLGRALLMSYSVEGVASLLAERLPGVGIDHAYLALRGEGGFRLVMALREGRALELPPQGLPLGEGGRIPESLLPRTRHCLVFESLFSADEALGYLAMGGRLENGVAYEELRGFASSAIKGALLFEAAREARELAEKADRVKTRLLANVSHELRAPLAIIVEEAEGGNPDAARIATNARYQLKLVNDLLELSRAEIEEIDLAREYLDPAGLIAECFESFDRGGDGVEWRLEAPESLPTVLIDPSRIRQILYNLLDNARRHTARGRITVSARIEPPFLVIEVRDTGEGIARDKLEAVFEPFFTTGSGQAGASQGVGLGLAISRQLAILHGGRIDLSSVEGEGSRFSLHIPLPRFGEAQSKGEKPERAARVIVAAGFGAIPPEVVRLSSEGYEIKPLPLDALGDWPEGEAPPEAIALDASSIGSAGWKALRRLRRDPRLVETPLLLFDSGGGRMRGVAMKRPGAERDLSIFIEASCAPEARGPALIVDDDQAQRARIAKILFRGFPSLPLLEASSSAEALASMQAQAPSIVILDLVMPGGGGEQVLEAMRADERLREVPVIIMTNKLLGEADLARLESYSHLVVQSKGVWTDDEIMRISSLALDDALGSSSSPVAKRALGWMLRNYEKPFSRWQLADAVGVSEDHLSRAFHRELGIGVWDFLNRYRIHKAKELLKATSLPVGDIAEKVGYSDQSYFCRVFRKLSGLSPQAFRQGGANH